MSSFSYLLLSHCTSEGGLDNTMHSNRFYDFAGPRIFQTTTAQYVADNTFATNRSRCGRPSMLATLFFDAWLTMCTFACAWATVEKPGKKRKTKPPAKITSTFWNWYLAQATRDISQIQVRLSHRSIDHGDNRFLSFICAWCCRHTGSSSIVFVYPAYCIQRLATTYAAWSKAPTRAKIALSFRYEPSRAGLEWSWTRIEPCLLCKTLAQWMKWNTCESRVVASRARRSNGLLSHIQRIDNVIQRTSINTHHNTTQSCACYSYVALRSGH